MDTTNSDAFYATSENGGSENRAVSGFIKAKLKAQVQLNAVHDDANEVMLRNLSFGTSPRLHNVRSSECLEGMASPCGPHLFATPEIPISSSFV
eukprot:c6194_g1_i1 orf=1-279(-)